jgi:phosphate transport system substrate-binding protein
MNKKILSFAFIALLFSCVDDAFVHDGPSHSRGKTKIFVEESFKPLFETSIYTFESLYQSAEITAIYCTESQAIDSFIANKTKTLFITRDFTDDEKVKLRKSQVEVRSQVLANDALALIVHPDNIDSSLTVPSLISIINGEKNTWESSGKTIDLVFDSPNSANFIYLKKLAGDSPIPSNMFAVNSNEEVIDYVKEHKNALGVIGVNWISDEDDETVLEFLDGIKVMQIAKNEQSEYFKPYQAYIHTKEYPLTRQLWAINKGSRSGLNTGFVNFLHGEKGQLIIHKSSLVPANTPIRMMQIKTE